MNRADDRSSTVTLALVLGGALVHFCPSACVVAPATREQLDPMALRHCQKPLPDEGGSWTR